MAENKKIIGATIVDYKGMQFRSKLELRIFKACEELKLNPLHEPKKFVLWEGFKPTVPFYIKSKSTRQLTLEQKKQIDITYTPDIIFELPNYYVIVEVKPSFCNDVYPYKRKMFRRFLEDYSKGWSKQIVFAQIGSVKEVKELLKILNNEGNN